MISFVSIILNKIACIYVDTNLVSVKPKADLIERLFVYSACILINTFIQSCVKFLTLKLQFVKLILANEKIS